MHDLLKIAKYWAIEPDILAKITRNSSAIPASFLKRNDDLDETKSLSFQSERRLGNTRSVLIRDGTAVIPIHGPITARSDLFSLFFGGTSLADLAKDFQTALDDDQVKAILFDVDSPGGVALGPSEMADAIFKARGKKPIWSYVGRNCSSAAYWIASATEKIIANPSALLGSIGVVTTIPVQEQPDLEGYKNIEIVSSNAKQKRPDPRTEEGIAEIKRELNDLEAQFIESVAKYRNVSVNAVKNDFGQGGVLIGKNAVASGMADSLGSYEEVMRELNQKISTNKQINFMTNDGAASAASNLQLIQSKNKNLMSTKETIERSAINADFIKAEFPEIAEKLAKENSTKITNEIKESSREIIFVEGKKAGFSEGIEAERKRILAIEEASLAGHEDLVAKAKQDADMTADKLALQIVAREKQRGTKYIEQAAAAEKEMPKVAPNFESASFDKTKIDKDAPLEDRAKVEWQNDAKLRLEFADDYDAYFAYKKASEANQVKILSNHKS
ncbi:MAG: S49 family peptidase [Proteobacteria bacterium]|nr:S49 family peptidase [Pseudomonadota bacterium]